LALQVDDEDSFYMMFILLSNFVSLFNNLCLPLMHVGRAYANNPLYDGIIIMCVAQLGNGSGIPLAIAHVTTSSCYNDAETPMWLWNDAIHDGIAEEPTLGGHTMERVDLALETLQTFLLCWVSRRGVTLSFFSHLRNKYEELTGPSRSAVKQFIHKTEGPAEQDGTKLAPDIVYTWQKRFGHLIYNGWWHQFCGVAQANCDPGKDAIWQVSEASWWDWDVGLTPFYWRWPQEYRETSRVGLQIWFSGEKPSWRRSQRAKKVEATRAKVIKKISKLSKVYCDWIRKLTDGFSVCPEGQIILERSTIEPPVGSTMLSGS
jgi:hypothetical protein